MNKTSEEAKHDAAYSEWLWRAGADFEATSATELLKESDFDAVGQMLSTFVEGKRNPRAVDWLHKGARMGHVPLLYFAVRNRTKMDTGTVQDSAALEEAFGWATFLLVRTAQDAHAVCTVLGEDATHVYAMLRDKIVTWMRRYDRSIFPPLEVILQRVRATSGTKEPSTLPSPAWVTTCVPTLGARIGFTQGIVFGTPCRKRLSACRTTRNEITEVRRSVMDRFLARAGREDDEDGVQSWDVLFKQDVDAFGPPAAGAASTSPTA